MMKKSQLLIVLAGTAAALVLVAYVGPYFEPTPQPAAAQMLGPLPAVAPALVGQARTTMGYEQITGIGTTTAVAQAVPAGTADWSNRAEDANLRWRSDGTDPTSSVGMLIYAGDTQQFDASLTAIRLISESGTGIANVHYEQ